MPRIADGGGWKTRAVIVNRSLRLTARPILNFFGQNGAPLAFSILGAGMVSNLERTIPPGGSLIVKPAGAVIWTARGRSSSWPQTSQVYPRRRAEPSYFLAQK